MSPLPCCGCYLLSGGLPVLPSALPEHALVIERRCITGLSVMLRVNAGRSPISCALWLMHPHGLVAHFVEARLGFRRLGGCASRFCGVRVRGGEGWVGRFFGVPIVPPPLWRQLDAGGFNFRVLVCAGRPLRFGGRGSVQFFFLVPSLRQHRVLLLSGAYLTKL